MLKTFKKFPLTALFAVALSAGSFALTGCDVEVEDEGPLEEVVEGDGLDVEIDD